jgi:L-alanine-DL-glutamate epimerase-like enolase superfamily enzyme
MRISHVDLDIQREPFARPFAFKGSAFHEKWNLVVRLEEAEGQSAFGLGGLAVLWSDPEVFAAHTETGGNALMVAVLEGALRAAQGLHWDQPQHLLTAVLPEAEAMARQLTGRGAQLQRTFVLNALVALDNAAWVLWARSAGVDDFEALVPIEAVAPLSHRQSRVALAPAVGYNMPVHEVAGLLGAGAAVLKLKIGHPGEEEAMVSGDLTSLERLAAPLADAETPLTVSGKVCLYLDANGRYRSREALDRLIAGADRLGLLDRILVLEEPFAADVTEPLTDLPVLVAADESLHDADDVGRRRALGYGAIAVKPAGKTLSVAFDMLAAAHREGAVPFVADNACVPVLVEWNKNVAARLPLFPGLRGGLMESNGPENYGRWSEMVAEHPCAGAGWIEARQGAYRLDDDYYRSSGGIFEDPDAYLARLRGRID